MAFQPHYLRPSKEGEPSPPKRDRVDWLTLFIGFSGVFSGAIGVAIALFTYLDAQRDQIEINKNIEKALKRMADLSESSRNQVVALSNQVQEMRLQSGELAKQSKSLDLSAQAAREQMIFQKGLVIQADQPAIRIIRSSVEHPGGGASFQVKNFGDKEVIIDRFEMVVSLSKNYSGDINLSINQDGTYSNVGKYKASENMKYICSAFMDALLPAGKGVELRCLVPEFMETAGVLEASRLKPLIDRGENPYDSRNFPKLLNELRPSKRSIVATAIYEYRSVRGPRWLASYCYNVDPISVRPRNLFPISGSDTLRKQEKFSESCGGMVNPVRW